MSKKARQARKPRQLRVLRSWLDLPQKTQKEKCEDYDDYAKTLSTYFNDELWDPVSISDVDGVNTQNFFEVYHTIFD